MYIGLPLRAFSRWYAVSGDRKALDMAQRLAAFLLKPSMWRAHGEEIDRVCRARPLEGSFSHAHDGPDRVAGVRRLPPTTPGWQGLPTKAIHHGQQRGNSSHGVLSGRDPIRQSSIGSVRRCRLNSSPDQRDLRGGGHDRSGDTDSLSVESETTGMTSTSTCASTRSECQMLRRDLLEEIIPAGSGL